MSLSRPYRICVYYNTNVISEKMLVDTVIQKRQKLHCICHTESHIKNVSVESKGSNAVGPIF